MKVVSVMRVLFCLLCGLVFTSVSYAQETPSENVIRQAGTEFSEKFDEVSQRHFAVMYGNFNLIQVVEGVRRDISHAVQECSTQNPDIKNEISERFENWTQEVNPILDEARGHVSNMILAQDYVPAADVRKFFDFIKAERAKHEEALNKKPVTSLKACKTLSKSMVSTQANMVTLLRSTLVSLPKAIQKDDAQ